MASSICNSLIPPAGPGMFERRVATKEARASPREWPRRPVNLNFFKSLVGKYLCR